MLRAYMHGYFMDIRLYHKVGGAYNYSVVTNYWTFVMHCSVLVNSCAVIII